MKLETVNWKLETGNWKLETGNWKLETHPKSEGGSEEFSHCTSSSGCEGV